MRLFTAIFLGSSLMLPPTILGAPASQCVPTLPTQGPSKKSYQTVTESFELDMPSGNRVYGMVRRPDPKKYPDRCFPAVIKVPGGINPGRMEILAPEARQIASAGMVVVGFNAEGRVDKRAKGKDLKSEGKEDFNGFRNQDSLHQIVLWTISLPYVLDDNVGLRTQSFGITMGAGCVGRYPELTVKYLIDGEGPSDSFVTCQGPRFLSGDSRRYDTVVGIFPYLAVWQSQTLSTRSFWAEREAIRFIGKFRGRYLRLQAAWDHAQPPDRPEDLQRFDNPKGWPGGGPAWHHNKHAIDMINTAIGGGVPWVQINFKEQRNTTNSRFDHAQPPTYLPGKLTDRPWAVRAVIEMASMK